MLIKISEFMSSNDISLKVAENFVINDEEFLSNTGLSKNIELNGEIFKLEDGVSFAGAIKYTFKDACARCLKEFENKNQVDFQAAIVHKEDEESDEIQMLIQDGIIEMDQTIKQLIYLSLPMKSICDENCKGICPNCGVNLNSENCDCEKNLTDPRFDKLKDLLNN